MEHIKAPNKYSLGNRLSVFLGGSIDMDKAERWQDKVVDFFNREDILFLNPRRDNFNSELEQSINCKEFVEQVEWELTALESVDVILFYLDPNGKAPITLLELGLFAAKNKDIYICCREGFWRKGNVDIVCRRYGVKQIDANSVEEFCEKIKEQIIHKSNVCKGFSMAIRGENGV